MVLYHANTSPRSLSTTADPLRSYPAHWELMKWYKCWRKYPYEAEIHAFLIAQTRSAEYAHYLCPLGGEHWHVGRGGNQADPRHIAQRAKRAFRKAVRDEIIAEYQEGQVRGTEPVSAERGPRVRLP